MIWLSDETDRSTIDTDFGPSNQLKRMWTQGSNTTGTKYTVCGSFVEENIDTIEVVSKTTGDATVDTVTAEIRDGLFIARAVLLTYLLPGLGLLGTVKAFSVSMGISNGIASAVAALAIGLGLYNFHDFLAWRKNKSSADMKLKLPCAVHRRMHAVMKSSLSSRSLVVAALVTGMAVSVPESVCTGQVYLPTIAFVLGDTSLRLHAFAYLVS